MHEDNNLLTRKEAALYLGISKGTLEVWACTKRYDLPYIKVGRLVRYRTSDLQAFLISRTIGNPASAEGYPSEKRGA